MNRASSKPKANGVQAADPTGPGRFLVTVCTRGLQPFLGEVVSGEVCLSPAGELVAEVLEETVDGFRFNVVLEESAVLPNHVHAIIVIEKNPFGSMAFRELLGVPLPAGIDDLAGRPWQRPDSIPVIVGQFKSRSTRLIKKAGLDGFGWEQRYDAREVRGRRYEDAVSGFVYTDALRWDDDRGDPLALIPQTAPAARRRP